uniref:myomegalin-like n=1 Tax=Ictidomys tridecemlineatus TaxID=43179 RepID=UPI001A9F6EAF|nr:myomegalin-like [Ictidomys tridecemlineatus]
MGKRKLACRFPGLQASELDSDDPPGMKNSLTLEGDTMDGSFNNKHGCHIIGHIDDYTALRVKIGEGKQLVQKIQALLRPTCNFPGLEAQSSEAPSNKCFHELRSSTRALQHILEKSASLLTMFWGAALPSFHSPGLPGKVDESMERELLDLRAQVSKQERSSLRAQLSI